MPYLEFNKVFPWHIKETFRPALMQWSIEEFRKDYEKTAVEESELDEAYRQKVKKEMYDQLRYDSRAPNMEEKAILEMMKEKFGVKDSINENDEQVSEIRKNLQRVEKKAITKLGVNQYDNEEKRYVDGLTVNQMTNEQINKFVQKKMNMARKRRA